MASLPIYDRSGTQVGSYEIELTDLAPRINKQLLHDATIAYQSNQRLGTAKTKTRGEVAGSTKKMYRQKGTGNARAGSRRSGLRRGGGHIFSKRPRDWRINMPRKALQLAMRMAIASKIKDNQIILIDDLKMAAPKTKEMTGILKALKFGTGKILVTTAAYDVNVYKSARNIDKVSVLPATELNAWDVMRSRQLLLTKSALDYVKQRADGAKKAT